jgi:hypothetical protein
MLLGAKIKFYVLRLVAKAHKTIFTPNNIYCCFLKRS